MQLIQGSDRHQTYFTTLDDQISFDNAVRLIDAFVDKLELHHIGCTGMVHHSEGRPPYAPSVLLKLYLYGYLNKIRSSRKLETECGSGRWRHQNGRRNKPEGISSLALTTAIVLLFL